MRTAPATGTVAGETRWCSWILARDLLAEFGKMSAWRVVQRGRAPVAVCYLVGPGARGEIDVALRRALPGVAIVATTESGRTDTLADLNAACRAAGLRGSTDVVLVGYSAGCQGVRAHLWAGVDPVAVVAIDGTHGSLPPSDAQVSVWRRVARDAETGTRPAVFTCTLQRYVERLRSGAYAATSTVLSRALDAPELATLPTLSRPAANYPGVPAWATHPGKLHAIAYPSTDCDHDAHLAQLRHVLPDTIGRYIAPELGVVPRDASSLVELVGDAVLAPVRGLWSMVLELGAGDTLGERAVRWSLAELESGVRERPGTATHPRIARYLAGCRRGGSPTAGMRGEMTGVAIFNELTVQDEIAWCAASASCATNAVLRPGERPPHGYRAAVREIVEDARALGTLRGLDYDPQPGDLVISARAGGDPMRGGTGHVERVVRRIDRRVVETVGGNESNTWVRAPYSLDDPSLRAFIACR